MTPEQAVDRAAADEAGFALLGLPGRVAALAEVGWRSPAAGLYRASISALSEDCERLRARLAAYIPHQP
ncbi:hypothetical protein [Naasia sp. SYSU D00948]|uniref:hypothetical protein n=1 Tax=Naasia sp. SYSU D00948 TaxID=2817379 RepID=UPI001B30FE9A|nr:hypothetical protein [Naasia sp. SYSU D00948]